MFSHSLLAVIFILLTTIIFQRDLSFQNEWRTFIGLLVGGVVTGSTVGYFLSQAAGRLLRHVTLDLGELTHERFPGPLPESGPIEFKQQYRAFNRLEAHLRQVKIARDQRLATLVHEIGRPLGAIRTTVQAVLWDAAQDLQLQHELLEAVDAEAGRLQQLLAELARLHEYILNPPNLAFRSISLSDWLPVVLRPWQVAARSRKLNEVIFIPPDLPTIYADPLRLAQAIGNLASNALKYTLPGGEVSIAAGVEANQVWISICDTGPGIPPETQMNVFAPFCRGDDPLESGMGLGLAVAHDVVSAHDGRLELDSSPDQGSRFTIWLPIRSS